MDDQSLCSILLSAGKPGRHRRARHRRAVEGHVGRAVGRRQARAQARARHAALLWLDVPLDGTGAIDFKSLLKAKLARELKNGNSSGAARQRTPQRKSPELTKIFCLLIARSVRLQIFVSRSRNNVDEAPFRHRPDEALSYRFCCLPKRNARNFDRANLKHCLTCSIGLKQRTIAFSLNEQSRSQRLFSARADRPPGSAQEAGTVLAEKTWTARSRTRHTQTRSFHGRHRRASAGGQHRPRVRRPGAELAGQRAGNVRRRKVPRRLSAPRLGCRHRAQRRGRRHPRPGPRAARVRARRRRAGRRTRPRRSQARARTPHRPPRDARPREPRAGRASAPRRRASSTCTTCSATSWTRWRPCSGPRSPRLSRAWFAAGARSSRQSDPKPIRWCTAGAAPKRRRGASNGGASRGPLVLT